MTQRFQLYVQTSPVVRMVNVLSQIPAYAMVIGLELTAPNVLLGGRRTTVTPQSARRDAITVPAVCLAVAIASRTGLVDCAVSVTMAGAIQTVTLVGL